MTWRDKSGAANVLEFSLVRWTVRKGVRLRRRPLQRHGVSHRRGKQEGDLAYRDLRDFVRKLEKAGELKRIKTEVDPILEITEVTQRVARDASRAKDSVGPALLFEKPKGSRVPLVVNTFGSVSRMAMAFEVDTLEEVAARISRFMDMKSPQGLFDK